MFWSSNRYMDNIIIDLKILAKIPQHAKILTRGEHIEIDTRHPLLQACMRTIERESGEITCRRLTNLLDDIYKWCSNAIQDNNIQYIQQITRDMQLAIVGLVNLKNTYYLDVVVQSKIERIIEKINEQIKKNNKVLFIKLRHSI